VNTAGSQASAPLPLRARWGLTPGRARSKTVAQPLRPRWKSPVSVKWVDFLGDEEKNNTILWKPDFILQSQQHKW